MTRPRQVVAAVERGGQIVAVCDDGTAWTLAEVSGLGTWKQIAPEVPAAKSQR
jgi:hypothetical protein